jgi:phosphopantetheine--protein transferase-like protein
VETDLIFWTITKVYAEWGQSDFEPDFLSPSENERLRQLRFPKRRREWLSGRWAAKNLLILSTQEYARLSLQKISVQNDGQGAPFFSVEGQGQLPMSLSISHRDESVFCAITSMEGVRIGVDIELVETRPASFLEDYFTDREAETVRQLDPDQRARWVTMGWSIKESFLKALGIGLRADTRRIEVMGGMQSEDIDADLFPWRQVDISTQEWGSEPVYGCWTNMGEYVLSMVARSDGVLDGPARGDWASTLKQLSLD